MFPTPQNINILKSFYDCNAFGTMTYKCDSSIVVPLIRKRVEYVQYYTPTHRRYI